MGTHPIFESDFDCLTDETMRLFLFATLLLCTFAQDDFGDFENDFDNEVDGGLDQCEGESCDKFEEDFDDVTVEDTEDVEQADENTGVPVGNEMMDVDEDEWDDDEFYSADVTEKDKEEKGEEQTLNIVNVSEKLKPKKPVYVIEYGLGVLLFLYVLNYIYGRVTNGNIAADWFEKAQSFLESQFALIGDSGEKELVSSMAMTREADHVFTLWCSGRNNIAGMLATLKMVKRQDVFTQVHAKYVVPTNDQMIVKFTLDKMDPICMAVGRSSALKDVLENYTDIGYFCQDKIRSGERYGLGKLSYVTESSDALHLFDKKIQQMLQGPVGNSLVSLHISDKFQGARVPEGEEQDPPSQSVIFVFDMNNIDLCATQFLKFAIHFVDHVNRYSLSREALEKHKKRRQKREDESNRMRHAERQEEMARKKEEERREEYQRMLDEQDPEKQKRLEYEFNRKDQKRNQRKSMKMKQMKIRT